MSLLRLVVVERGGSLDEIQRTPIVLKQVLAGLFGGLRLDRAVR